MTNRKGSISVDTADIFPIIKKWLYSEHDIFIRELIANASDAITKRSTLGRIKNQEIPDGKISILINKDEKIIQVTDNGIGMTEEEVEKYIAKLAFSGAKDFVEKIKDSSGDNKDIIGKFGLGFFSSFMVSSRVDIDTLSMEAGAKPTKWTCTGETDYIFSESNRNEIGTTITLHINEDGEEFLDEYKLKGTIRNHCDFMPYPIFVETTKNKDDDKKEKEAPEALNDTKPLWKQDPTTLKDEDYINFYRKLFPMDQGPLFWIHLKVDHPFTLDGILYFPKLNLNRPFNESNIRLYCKQVFVSDSVKNIIPEFLSLLKGAIDSIDIPLNVSRSSLQGDPNVKKISNYIIKKVAESLKKLFSNDREKFEKIWEDIGLFTKYGIISDTKFDELMREMIIFKNSDGKYQTMTEYTTSVPENYKDKLKDKIIYFEKEKSDHSLRAQLLSEGIHCLETEEHIDPHFMQHVEMRKQGDSSYKFAAIDSEIENLLEVGNASDTDLKIKDLFKLILVGDDKKKDDKNDKDGDDFFSSNLEIEVKNIKNTTSPAYFKVDESMKRLQQMTRSMGNQNGSFPIKKTLVVNPGSELIKNAYKIWEKGENKELAKKLCLHVKDLATISSVGLEQKDRTAFVGRSQELIQELTGLI